MNLRTTLVVFGLSLFCFSLSASIAPQYHEPEDIDLIQNEFDLENKKSKSFIWIGDLQSYESILIHENDMDLIGAELLGYPDDDDLGRTATLRQIFKLNGKNGQLRLDFVSTLFTKEVEGLEDVQNILEANSISLQLKKFVNKDKNYLIARVKYENQVEKARFMTEIQDFVHKISGSTERESVEGDLDRHIVDFAIGLGKSIRLLNGKRVKITLGFETSLNLSTAFEEESGLHGRASLEIAYDNPDVFLHPRFAVRLYGESELLFFEDVEYSYGIEAGITLSLNKDKDFYFTIRGGVTVFKSRLDSQFEGGRSYNSHIMLGFKKYFRPLKEREMEYMFD